MTVAILLMAGSGTRFGDILPKQYHTLFGFPLYQYALNTFISSKLFKKIFLVLSKEHFKTVPIERIDVEKVVGGKTRQESVFRALQACDPDTNYVVIHDVARPFVTREIIKENIQAVQKFNAVDTCLAVSDTIVQKNEREFITSIPNRSNLLLGQTPQSFSYPLIVKAHLEAKKSGVQNATDDCQLILKLPHPVFTIEGSKKNFKITSPEDLQFAEYLISKENVLK